MSLVMRVIPPELFERLMAKQCQQEDVIIPEVRDEPVEIIEPVKEEPEPLPDQVEERADPLVESVEEPRVPVIPYKEYSDANVQAGSGKIKRAARRVVRQPKKRRR